MLQLQRHTILGFSVLRSVQDNTTLYTRQNRQKLLTWGRSYQTNLKFTQRLTFYFFITCFVIWLAVLLLLSGNVHPNPGPLSLSSVGSTSSSSSSSFADAVFDPLNLDYHLSFVQYNVQSIAPKLDILHAELHAFDILAFTETWLSASTLTNDLLFQSYHPPERKDRVEDRHGGVMLYVKEGLHYRRRQDLEPKGIECLWIEIINKHKHVLFGLFYRPPNSDANYYSTIEDSIHLAVDTGLNDIIVTGDFNFNLLSAQTSRKIEYFCTQFSLYQSIDQPTHFTENSSSLLDIIFIHNKDHLILSGVGDPFLDQQLRYHCPIYGIFRFAKPKLKSFTRQIWNYDQGDFNLLRTKATNTDWESLRDNDINVYANNFTNHILYIAKECIPNRVIRVRPSDPPWLTTYIKRFIRKRKRAYRKAKLTNLPTNWNKFRKLRNKVVNMIREAKNTHTDKISDKLKSGSISSRDWWTILKLFISPKTRSTVPPIEHNGAVYTEDQDKATLLNDFFQIQTLLNDQNAALPDIPRYNVESKLSTIALTPLEVESVLKTLVVGKASGPNGVNNRILKELSREISQPLCSLFNYSLQTCTVPNSWKESNVCPVPKKDNESQLSNYRPISLLNSEGKVFERLIFKHLFNHLRDNNILTSMQSGFIPGDSTVNQLTFLYNTFCRALDDGKEVRVVFCDISKAFDRVWHAGLIHKLEAAGVSGRLLVWFKNYLSDRKQRVVLPGAYSDWTNIRAGVPQGSILGPLLFLVFINDIVNDIGSNIRLFADDTSVYIIVDNPLRSAELLSADLEKISLWANTWLVTFNPAKTESLLISRKLIKPDHPPLYMQNQHIAEVETHKHLGLYLSSDCSWHQHIKYITDRA